MGKKSRRERGSNREYLRKKADEKVDAVEEADPEYNNLEKLPKGLAQLALKYRFGGAHLLRGNLRSVKICSGLVVGMRKSRSYQRGELFDGDTQIWAARDAIALNESDGDALDEYIGAVVGLQFPRMIGNWEIGGGLIGVLKSVDNQYARLSLKTVESWPRVRPHWKRFRRRLCDNCPACAHLAEPRSLVCSGCGRKRYCSEKFQREDWPAHQKDCLKWQKLIIQQDLADVEQNLAELDAREKDTER